MSYSHMRNLDLAEVKYHIREIKRQADLFQGRVVSFHMQGNEKTLKNKPLF